MKTWAELADNQRRLAVREMHKREIKDAVERPGVFFAELHRAIMVAHSKASTAQTPWFAAEYIVDEPFGDTTVGETLRGIAEARAEEAIYLERGEIAISGIL